MMSIDFNRAGLLLHICDLSVKWPRLKAIHDAAMAELEGMKAEEPKAETPRPVVQARYPRENL